MPDPREDLKKREELKKAEKEIGENIPEEMIGLDSEDAGTVGKEQDAA